MNAPRRPIVVVGSLNRDLVMRMARAPNGGETLSGTGYGTYSGGKGANQAVACARMGAPVAMVGCLGADGDGRLMREGLVADGIDVDALTELPDVHTGVAMIWVEDASGENRIVLAPGANGRVDAATIARAGARIDAAAMLVLQLEIPMDAVVAAAQRARRAGVPVLLNPAPAAPLPDALWAAVDLLVVNETEAAMLSGVAVGGAADAARAGAALRARGPGRVLVTLGAAGVAVVDDAGSRHRPAQAVQAVDTTSAGDTFIGGVAAALREGASLDDAVALGQAASAICVTRAGAQASIPRRAELGDAFRAAAAPAR